MESGETSPTMVATHGELFTRLGEDAGAVLLDTPYAFQENAAEISAKAQACLAPRWARATSRHVQPETPKLSPEPQLRLARQPSRTAR